MFVKIYASYIPALEHVNIKKTMYTDWALFFNMRNMYSDLGGLCQNSETIFSTFLTGRPEHLNVRVFRIFSIIISPQPILQRIMSSIDEENKAKYGAVATAPSEVIHEAIAIENVAGNTDSLMGTPAAAALDEMKIPDHFIRYDEGK